MASAPRVSVVMTVYNNAAYLAEAVESIFAQDERSWELILVDDGSTDESPAVIAGYGDRVRAVRRDNGGLGAARNTGLALARAELVAFCDADDIHLPYRLAAHAALLEAHPEAALVFSELAPFKDGQVLKQTLLRDRKLGPTRRSFDEEIQAAFGRGRSAREEGVPLPPHLAEARVYRGRVAPLIALTHVAWGGASMFRRRAVVAVGAHDEGLRRYTDWSLVSRLAKSYELVFLDVPVLHYRLHEQQLTRQSLVGAQCYRRVIEEVWRADPVFYAQHREIVDRALGLAHWQIGQAEEARGDWGAAAAAYLASIRANPRQRRVFLDWARLVARRSRSGLERLVPLNRGGVRPQ